MGKVDSNIKKDISYTAVNNEKGNDELRFDDLGPVPVIGARHLQCTWYFILLFIAFGVRVTLSVAIVAMTDPSASVNPNIPTYPEWTQKGAILSAFFWGYIWPQILAGYVANRFGAKWFLISTMGIQSVLTAFTPHAAAFFGEKGVMAVRAIQGFSQGFFIPTIAHLLSHWVPKEEKARLTSFTTAGVSFGTVIALLITGIIAAGPYGWPMVFYLYGALGLIWCLLFSFFGYDGPTTHPTINKAEKYYIMNSLGHTEEKRSHKVPWKGMFTSAPVWALVTVQCGFIFGFWILLTQIPTYMNRVMNYNIKDNSILSSLPYMTQLILTLAFSFLSDFIINKKLLGQTASRKLFSVIAAIFPAIALIFLAFTKSDQPHQAVMLLIVAVGTSAACTAGFTLNFMDLTSAHAGTLMGLCNAASNIFSIWAPLMVQFLVKDQNDPEQWKIVFFVAAGTYVVTTIIYVIFGSAEKQPWNEDQGTNKDNEKQ